MFRKGIGERHFNILLLKWDVVYAISLCHANNKIQTQMLHMFVDNILWYSKLLQVEVQAATLS